MTDIARTDAANTDVANTEPLILTERIAAPREVVFDFLIDPEKLSRWMGAVTHDPRPGGSFELDMGDNVASGEYLRVEPPSLVSFTWGWRDTEAVPPGSTVVTITLTDAPQDGDIEATLVELRHDGLPMGPADEHRGGWTRCLDRLPYEAARDALRAAELELMLQRETVAAQRRSLPPGPVVDDYVFGAADGDVAIADLFTGPDRPLVLYHFMFGGKQEAPCPMCAMWADGWNGIADPLAERVDFAVVSAAPIEPTLALADERGWSDLRWLSATGTTFKRDIGGEDADGNQSPFISVYEQTSEGVRLSYSASAHIDGDHWRGVDLLSPVWHLLDLTRAGRGDWMPSH